MSVGAHECAHVCAGVCTLTPSLGLPYTRFSPRPGSAFDVVHHYNMFGCQDGVMTQEAFDDYSFVDVANHTHCGMNWFDVKVTAPLPVREGVQYRREHSQTHTHKHKEVSACARERDRGERSPTRPTLIDPESFVALRAARTSSHLTGGRGIQIPSGLGHAHRPRQPYGERVHDAAALSRARNLRRDCADEGGACLGHVSG